MTEQDDTDDEDEELDSDEVSNSEAAVLRGYKADAEKTRTKGTKEEEEIDEDFGAEFWGDDEIVDD